MNLTALSRNQTRASHSGSTTSSLLVVGINHHSCPLYIREKFVIPESCIGHALAGLASMPHIKEAVLLSTCNRTEVFAVVSDVTAAMTEIDGFFAAAQRISDHGVLKPDFRLLHDDVALHLFRVTSGLDSLVLGEGQILSQVKTAFKLAQQAGTTGPVLEQLFQQALACGKKVRTDTTMGRRAVSVSAAAVELARELTGGLAGKTVLVVGAGKMGQICVKHLLSGPGQGPVIMVNRSRNRLEQFTGNRLPNVERLNTGLDFEDRHDLAAASDVVIVSTSAPRFTISSFELQTKLSGRDVAIIDISVPRNVDPEVSSLPGVKLFHADDLAGIVNRNLKERQALTHSADEIVFEFLTLFQAWQRSLVVAPTISDLRAKIEDIRAKHLESVEAMSPDALEELSRALVNQILHHPTIQLKATSDYGQLRQQAEALRKLFDLDTFGGCPQSHKRNTRANQQ